MTRVYEVSTVLEYSVVNVVALWKIENIAIQDHTSNVNISEVSGPRESSLNEIS